MYEVCSCECPVRTSPTHAYAQYARGVRDSARLGVEWEHYGVLCGFARRPQIALHRRGRQEKYVYGAV